MSTICLFYLKSYKQKKKKKKKKEKTPAIRSILMENSKFRVALWNTKVFEVARGIGRRDHRAAYIVGIRNGVESSVQSVAGDNGARLFETARYLYKSSRAIGFAPDARNRWNYT